MTNLVMNRIGVLFALCAMLFIVSCDKDEPSIDGGDGLNVADGLYLQLDGSDPSSTAGLVAEKVEANDFQSQDRVGFTSGYMWLDAGNYSLVEVANKKVTSTSGGTIQTVDDEGSDCNHNEYTVVSTEAGGPAFNVASSGLYKVTNDQMTNEMTMYQIVDASIIGNATAGGWSTDTPLQGSLTADGGSWSASDIILRSGEWKVRFNCRWGINRRIDPNGSLNDASNGYQLFTNFGGSSSSLETGGSNITQTEDGVYTVTINWAPRDGFSLDLERTGDAPVITFNPNDFKMAVIGDATANSWDNDRNLFHKEDNGVHTWYGVVTFGDTGSYKFRANDNWDDLEIGGDLANLSKGGANIPTPGAGGYYIALTTTDEGETWSAMVSDLDWSVIGDGSPSASWDSDTDLESLGFNDGISSYSLVGDFTTAGWKFRAGRDWKHNIGGDLTFLTVDGDNIELAGDGNYTVTLNFDGEVYSATVE